MPLDTLSFLGGNVEYQESETVELKATFVESIKKEIVAFANTDGGKLFVGVADNGEVVGLDDADEVSLKISNMVRDSIKPDVTMFLHHKTLDQNNMKVLEIEVQRGTDRPYYIAKKGMRPEGVYVRQGFSSVPATDAAIRAMIKETDGDVFETMRSLDQNLSFQATEEEFDARNVKFGKRQMKTLQFIDSDGLFTNLALLLSDENNHKTKVAVFEGTNQEVFKDRREFGGSLLQQMNEIFGYIDIHNKTHAKIEGLSRIENRDYPEIAVREALLNLLIHRDYSLSANSLISILDDRLEFLSVGGLMPNIELEDVMAGLSVCRNQNLANAFYHLQLIEAYGTGLEKITSAYKDVPKKPEISATKNSFKIILPNVNFKSSSHEEVNGRVNGANFGAENEDTNEAKVLNYVAEHGSITRPETENLIGMSASTATRLIRSMVNAGQLAEQGNAMKRKYVLAA